MSVVLIFATGLIIGFILGRNTTDKKRERPKLELRERIHHHLWLGEIVKS